MRRDAARTSQEQMVHTNSHSNRGDAQPDHGILDKVWPPGSDERRRLAVAPVVVARLFDSCVR